MHGLCRFNTVELRRPQAALYTMDRDLSRVAALVDTLLLAVTPAQARRALRACGEKGLEPEEQLRRLVFALVAETTPAQASLIVDQFEAWEAEQRRVSLEEPPFDAPAIAAGPRPSLPPIFRPSSAQPTR